MKKIWIDTDPGVDDTLAIALLLESADQIDIVGYLSCLGMRQQPVTPSC